MTELKALIAIWYHKNKRDLPWRNTKDPYIIWISEIILQQTRVDQGMAYFYKFTEYWPTVTDLAQATEDEVLKAWQGLGYYSRARNLHATAKIIAQQYHGRFPTSFKNILELKGVGSYTAAAIASFAFDLPHAVVDGNVYRFLSRYFGIQTPIDSGAAKKQFSDLAHDLLDKKSPARHNQAIMEFGALQCKPANPDCASCPLSPTCYAFSHNAVKALPVKSKSIRITKRYFNYLRIHNKNMVVIRKRDEKDIWNGLYDFPLIETEKAVKPITLMKSAAWSEFFNDHTLLVKSISRQYIHKLSHQTIHSVFFDIEMDQVKALQTPSNLVISMRDFGKYAIPRLLDIYIKEQIRNNTDFSG